MNTNLKRLLAGAALLVTIVLPRPAAASSDMEMLRMAREMPGFGGLFYDDTGAVVVHMLDISRTPEVLTRMDIRALGRRIRVVEGTYDFQDLYHWRNELHDVLAEPNVVWIDIDERRNRVVIGVDEKSATSDTFSLLDSLRAATSAPRDAVIVERVPRIHPVQTVQNLIRPVPGGYQLNFQIPAGSFLCTLGFNANRAGVVGFVTNSHCSATTGAVNGTVYHQNVQPNRIGVETVDPPFLAGITCPRLGGLICPVGFICRCSDSLFARYDANTQQEFARIAKTQVPNAASPFTASLTINTPVSRWTIVGTAPFPIAGEILNKVGRTTGWSRGAVALTCISVNYEPPNKAMLCQDAVNARVLGGDSGSPVFRASGVKADVAATLIGILWGGNAAGTQFVFSAWENIILPTELGPLVVF